MLHNYGYEDDLSAVSEFLGELAAALPTKPGKAGQVKVSVASIQATLRALGYKNSAINDGKWGPTTAGLWQDAAKQRRLDGAINRASATEAWVMPSTVEAIVVTAKPAAAAAAAPKAPAGPPLTIASVAAMQQFLVALGRPTKGLTDGKWGPTSKGAWEAEAKKRGLDATTVGKAGDAQVRAVIATFNALGAAAGAAVNAKKAAAAPKAPAGPPMTIASVAAMQQFLVALGRPTKGLTDGKWGPTSKGAWEAEAKKRGLDAATVGKAGDAQVRAVIATFNALGAAAGAAAAAKKAAAAPAPAAKKPAPAPAAKKPAPAPAAKKPAPAPAAKKPAPTPAAAKPVAPSKSGMAKHTVDELQIILRKLTGQKSGITDRLWGPTTAGLWRSEAAKHGADGTIDRAGPSDAWVMPAAFNALLTAAKPAAQAAAQHAAQPAHPAQPQPKPTAPSARPTHPSKPGMTQLGVRSIQAILSQLTGKSSGLTDGLWGPTTEGLWKSEAVKRGLDGTIDRAGPQDAWVVPETVTALSRAVAPLPGDNAVGPLPQQQQPEPVQQAAQQAAAQQASYTETPMPAPLPVPMPEAPMPVLGPTPSPGPAPIPYFEPPEPSPEPGPGPEPGPPPPPPAAPEPAKAGFPVALVAGLGVGGAVLYYLSKKKKKPTGAPAPAKNKPARGGAKP